MPSPASQLLLLGAGKMGGALLASWRRTGWKASQITVVDPHANHNDVRSVASLAEATGVWDAIILAVKPQSMDSVLPVLGERMKEGAPLLLSIAAGKTIAYFEKHLPASSIVRAMPNTPALIGMGITALIANTRTTEAQKQLADALMKAAGQTIWLEDETQMDAVTAISGSGPAYMFLLLEALTEAGKTQGLPDPLSRKLAEQTMLGSAALAAQSEESLAQLRKNVTSPGGTTEAALKILMQNDALQNLVRDAVAQAVQRSKELA